MLLDAYMERYVLMDKTREPDGEGGFITSWKDGAPFDAAVTLDTTIQARIAAAQGVASVYTVTTSRSCVLEYHDVIKRLSDGAVFRITSNGGEKMTPKTTSFDIAQVTAERWELT